MDHSLKTGICFGLTSGTITTLGLMIGLYSVTQCSMVVIGGILTISIADAFSDAAGIHMSEESENIHNSKEIWKTTFFTFFSKFIIGLTFVFSILFFQLLTAIIINIIWGLLLLSVVSFCIAKDQKIEYWKVIIEHLAIALIVIVITYYLGKWISLVFG